MKMNLMIIWRNVLWVINAVTLTPCCKAEKQLLVMVAVTQHQTSRTVMDDDVRRWRVLTVVSPCQKAGFSLRKADAFFPLSFRLSSGAELRSPLTEKPPDYALTTSVGLLTDCRNVPRIITTRARYPASISLQEDADPSPERQKSPVMDLGSFIVRIGLHSNVILDKIEL